MAGYQIADEPSPGALSRFAVDPVYPFLAAMIGGLWIAWPWFVFNSLAVGSPTFRKELVWLASGLVGLLVLATALVSLSRAGIITGVGLDYARLALTVAKLGVVYAVHSFQSRTIEIYQYFGGELRNGFIVIVALIFLNFEWAFDGLPVIVRLVLQ